MDYVSVIIPVFNQLESLLITLKMFSKQTIPTNKFEIVIIDDGSDENICNTISKQDYAYELKLFRQKNSGRAAARNAGIRLSKGNILIFCDADRFPNPNFIARHLEIIKKNHKAVSIGCPLDYFGQIEKINMSQPDWNDIERFSRKTNYYKNMSYLFSVTGYSTSPISWIACLSGNLSLHKDTILKSGGFNELFINWGLEHFELGLRLYNLNFEIVLSRNNCNYHIPHPREKGFYKKMIINNFQIFQNVHPNTDLSAFKSYLLGYISLQELEMCIGNGKIISTTLLNRKPIKLNIIN